MKWLIALVVVLAVAIAFEGGLLVANRGGNDSPASTYHDVSQPTGASAETLANVGFTGPEQHCQGGVQTELGALAAYKRRITAFLKAVEASVADPTQLARAERLNLRLDDGLFEAAGVAVNACFPQPQDRPNSPERPLRGGG